MQRACIAGLMELAEQDDRVLYLTADSGEGGLDRIFRMNFPERSFDFGIAENNLAAAAAGLAMAGKIPFVYAPAPFLIYRSYEFIRNDVCLQNQNVKFLATGSGLSVGALGPTHHTTEDIALLRSLPNLTVFSPCSPLQVSACMKAAYSCGGPVYIRLGMNCETERFEDGYTMDGSGCDLMRTGTDAVIFCTGDVIAPVLDAAEALEISAAVVYVHTLKPLQPEALLRFVGSRRAVITVEEHNIYGGLGSILAECIAACGAPAKLKRIGLMDRFAGGYSRSSDQLRKENGLDAVSIAAKIREAL